jgi:hypothetical protein
MKTYYAFIIRTLTFLLPCFVLFACAMSKDLEIATETVNNGSYQSHMENSDFDEVIGSKQDGLVEDFDPSWLMSDLFFEHVDSISTRTLQQFFESSPYGKRSWLAEAKINRIPASTRIIQVARTLNINPILLLVRMQVEQSLISRTETPSPYAVDYAFGCGCHDYQVCSETHRGLDKQLICAGKTLVKLYTQSQENKGAWRAGRSRTTLDQMSIMPANHATAALYAYTPWVLPGRGGNWLVWNITRKFVRFLKEQDLFRSDLSSDYKECLYQSGRSFIGDACACDEDCNFWSSDQKGFCHPAGFCSLSCEGGCPDLIGKASTFCIHSDLKDEQGICVPQADESNGHCADLPGTLDRTQERYVGQSNTSPTERKVCLPTE